LTYHIRAAQPADVPQIHALILALAEFESLTHLVVASEADLARALFADGSRVAAQVAEADQAGSPDGQLVAFALYFHNYSTFLGRQGLYLEDLFVLPDWRKRGIARALLQRLAGIAVARGCGRFEWSVLDWNVNAIRFYESLGAQVLPDWRIVRMTGAGLTRLATPGDPTPSGA
jgi:GNAT superfamily N-acetyltransferase